MNGLVHLDPRRPLRLLVVRALLVLLCWPSRLLAGDEVPGPIVTRIDLECGAPIDRAGLTRLIPLRVGEPFRQTDLEESKRLLERTELFTSVLVGAKEESDGVAVVITLVRHVVVNRILFRGNVTFSSSELRRATRLQEGTTFSDELRDYGLQRLREHFADQGFPDARIEAEVTTLSPGEIDATFVVEEGPALHIETLRIDGDVPLPADELKALLPLKAGGRFVKPEVKAGEKVLRRALREAEYFEAEVESSWQPTERDQGTLTYKVDAGPRFELHFDGNQYFGDAALLELLDVLDRPIITDGTWRELARRARRTYQAAGFHQAKVAVRVEPELPRRVYFEIEEGRQRTIGTVRFEGNRILSSEFLQQSMATRPPSTWPWVEGTLVDDVLDEDLKRIWFQYRHFGCMDARILDARADVDETNDTLIVTIVIDEGVQTLVGAIERDGFEVLESLPPSPIEVGKALDPDTVEDDRRALASSLFKAGYAEAQVDATVEPDSFRPDSHGDTESQSVRVRFHARPGERKRVGTIIVQNNIDTQARVVLRELPFKKGDPLDPDALLSGQSKIYGLGLFRTVTVRPLPDQAGTEREIGVSLSERFPGTLQWGVGYNTRDGMRGFAEVGYSNLQGLARRISLRGDFSLNTGLTQPDEYIGNLGYLDPRLFDTRWTLRTNLVAQRSTRSIDQFSIERIALLPAIERPIFPGLTVGLEAQLEHARIFDVAHDVLVFNPRDEGDLETVSAGPFVVFDGRDDAFLPTRGVFESLRVRFAPQALGSDIPFVKIVAQHSHFLPLGNDFTFVYAARGGWSQTLRSGDVLPIRERFFLGGRTTVRGFEENEIGPKGAVTYDELGHVVDSGGNPLGGDLVISLTTELRFPLAFGLAGALFADAGAVYLQERPILVEDIRESVGPGLRYATPIGPISLDYGFKLDRRHGESIGQLHFSIGTIF